MIFTITLLLDLVRLGIGIVLAYFVFYLYQTEFRSGVMENGFKYITISFVILDIGRVADLVSTLEPNNGFSPILAMVSGTVFSLVACYGFFLLYRVWHVKREKTRLKEEVPSTISTNLEIRP
jgi:pilus assembly protein TadC